MGSSWIRVTGCRVGWRSVRYGSMKAGRRTSCGYGGYEGSASTARIGLAPASRPLTRLGSHLPQKPLGEVDFGPLQKLPCTTPPPQFGGGVAASREERAAKTAGVRAPRRRRGPPTPQ